MGKQDKFIDWNEKQSLYLTHNFKLHLTINLTTNLVTNKFSEIRYAQCWEDTDILLAGLNVQSHHTCLSIASGGDNTLALLTAQPQKVIAIDFSLAQIACLELRAAAYQNLSYQEMIDLVTSKADIAPELRLALFQRCQVDLSPATRRFWSDRQAIIAQGLMSGGKFERYLRLFRQRILPLIHSPSMIENLFKQIESQKRQIWFQEEWNTWRWQLIFKLFFSRFVMGRLGRDPSFFKYVEDNVAQSILTRANTALMRHNPQTSSYLQWIALGNYQMALPYALRSENFAEIHNNLNRLEIHHLGLKEYLKKYPSQTINRFNLSNIFEWISLDNYVDLMQAILKVSEANTRLLYWNLLVDRHSSLLDSKKVGRSPFTPCVDLSKQLYRDSKIFFYKRLVIEDIIDQ